MSTNPNIKILFLFLLSFLITLFVSCSENGEQTVEQYRDLEFIHHSNGPTIGHFINSGVEILQVDGAAFKDLNKNGELDPYEDWRLSAEERAEDLASQMSVEQIAGLMLYSAHQSIPASEGGTYNGAPLSESDAESSDLTDQQEQFLQDDNLRHVLITTVESPAVAAQWNNKAQAFVEGLGLGIPMNTSSDPRHETAADAEFNEGAGGDPLEDFDNRSFQGKTVETMNESDLDSVIETRELMGDKPVVVAINMSNPMVFSEFEELVDGIIVHFGVQDQALLDIISGAHEPSALLPLQMPADMATVENQTEDVPHDMETHVDTEGNSYDFGFGLNWEGVISDERTSSYVE